MIEDWDEYDEVFAREFSMAIFEKKMFIKMFYGHELDDDEVWEMALKVKEDQYPDIPDVILEHFNPNNANYKRHGK